MYFVLYFVGFLVALVCGFEYFLIHGSLGSCVVYPKSQHRVPQYNMYRNITTLWKNPSLHWAQPNNGQHSPETLQSSKCLILLLQQMIQQSHDVITWAHGVAINSAWKQCINVKNAAARFKEFFSFLFCIDKFFFVTNF